MKRLKNVDCLLDLVCLLLVSTSSIAQESFSNKEETEAFSNKIAFNEEKLQEIGDANNTELYFYMQKFPRQKNISGPLFNSLEIKKENLQNINKELKLDSVHGIGSNSYLLEFQSKNKEYNQNGRHSIDIAIQLTNSYETAYMMLLKTVMAECSLFSIGVDLRQNMVSKTNSIDYYRIYLPGLFFCFQRRNIVVGISARGWHGGAPQELMETVANYIDNYLLNQSSEKEIKAIPKKCKNESFQRTTRK